MEHIFKLTSDLKLIADEEASFDQNSIGTEYFSAKLDGWSLGDNEALLVAFEKEEQDKTVTLAPILMCKECGLNLYFSLMPDEVMKLVGEWSACIYKIFNYDKDTDSGDVQKVGEKFFFTVAPTIFDASGKVLTKYDVATMYDAIKGAMPDVASANGAAERAEASAKRSEQARADLETAQEAAEAAQRGAENAQAAAEAARDTLEGAARTAANKATDAVTAAAAALNSAKSAEEFAEIARKFASGGLRFNTDYDSVSSLPETGDSHSFYLIPNGGDAENSYDEYVWVEDKQAYEKIGTTHVDLTAYLPRKEASETYLSKSDARNTYATKDALAETYLTKDDARETYLPREEAVETLLAKDDASETYLTQADAAQSYATKDGNHQNMIVGKADKLTTARSIDGVSFDGTANMTHYGECATSKATAEKIVTIKGFTVASNGKPANGTRVTVKFINANSEEYPTLNVNGSGAIQIKADGDTRWVKWIADTVMDFVYDGTNWVCVAGYPLAGKRVGCIYPADIDNGTSPATLYGGSWTAIKDRFLYCVDEDNLDNYVDRTKSKGIIPQGGSNSHTLTIDETPEHGHGIGGVMKLVGWPTAYSKHAEWNIKYYDTEQGVAPPYVDWAEFTEEGGGQSFSTMPSYQAIYAWRRTA